MTRLLARGHLALAVLSLATLLAGCGGETAGDGSPSGGAWAAGEAVGPAWTLTTRVTSIGGTLTSPNGAAQVTADGLVTQTWTSVGAIPVSAAALPGYAISQVIVNGRVVASSGATWSGTVTAGVTNQVTVAFTAVQRRLNAVAGPGGTVTPAGFNVLTIGNTATVTFKPNTGSTVTSITVEGAAGATCAPGPCSGPWAANTSVAVTATVGVSTIAVRATFSGPPVAIGSPNQQAKLVPPGALVALDGRGSYVTTTPITSYAWTQTTPTPVAVTLAASGPIATFTAPQTEGLYQFTLTVQPGGSTAAANVRVTTNPVGSALFCQSCHAGSGVGTASQVWAKWSVSRHALGYVACWECHVGRNDVGHSPSLPVSPTTFAWTAPMWGHAVGSNYCASCHAAGEEIVTEFQASVHATTGPRTCSGCHGDAHAALSGTARCVACHAAGGTVTGHPFAVAASAACVDCHNPHSAVAMPGGGHDVHLTEGIGCRTCHVTVIGVVAFDPAGPAVSPSLPPPAFDPVTKTCSSVACHSVPPGQFDYSFPGGDGEPLPYTARYGGGATTPPWDATPTGSCTACHDLTYQGGRYLWHSGVHGSTSSGGNACQTCHPDATGTATWSNPMVGAALSTATTCGPTGRTPCALLHQNGVLDVAPRFRAQCFNCH